MPHARRESPLRPGKQSGTDAAASPEPRRPPFRSKLLPVLLSAALGLAGAGLFIFRDIARAQTSVQTRPHAPASASRAAAGKKAPGGLPGRKASADRCRM